MKRIIAILLSVVLFVNLFGITATAEMDNLWNLIPTGLNYEEQQDFMNRLEAAAGKILKGISGNDALSDVQKALLIHDRLVDSCEYDLELEKRFATDTLLDGVSVCTGYSYAYKYLLEKIGIHCTFETSEIMQHLWNIVYLDGKKYYVDLTFDDPSYDISGRVEHNNFLISSEKFAVNHAGYFNGNNYDFDMTLDNHEYEDEFWNCSEAAIQVIGSDIYYIDTENGKLMKLGNSTPLASLTINWSVGQYYYPGNFSRLASDGYCLYYSDMRSIYKFDVSTNKSTVVYTLGSGFNSNADIFGFTYKDCKFIFEATDDLSWDIDTKSQIQRTVSIDHYYGDSETPEWSSDTDKHWIACLVCGEKKSIADHTFSASFQNDETSHWYECTVCGVRKEWQEHIYESVCDTDCNICGYIRTAEHSPVEEWSKNATKHWHNCTNCNLRVNEGDHVFDNACDTTCNTCGYVRTITHNYKTVWTSDGTAHWHECSICGVKKDIASHTFDNSCDTTCNICGYVRTTSHNYKTVWTSDGTTHWHECSICGVKKDVAGHTWNAGVITTAATPDSDGVRTYTCTVCGKTKTESVKFVGVGGIVTSFGDLTDDITVSLYKAGETTPLEELTLFGNSSKYLFWNVAPGNYKITVSKINHVSRTYDVTVGTDTVTLNAKIHRIGDINGDGVINGTDLQSAENHLKSASLLTGYALLCADINSNGTVTAFDLMLINAHRKAVRLLWS